MKKKQIILSVILISIVLIVIFWINGTIPKQIGRIVGTYKINKEFPEWQLEYVDIVWGGPFGDYHITFKDKDGNSRGCFIGPKYFPISLGQGMHGLRETYSNQFSK